MHPAFIDGRNPEQRYVGFSRSSEVMTLHGGGPRAGRREPGWDAEAMSQTDAGWGVGPSGRYEDLAGRFRPVFAEIRATAVERDRTHGLPDAEIGWLREANFTTLRLDPEVGGHGASLPELFNLLIELSQADSNVTNALRAH